MTTTFEVKTTCFECKTPITFVTDNEEWTECTDPEWHTKVAALENAEYWRGVEWFSDTNYHSCDRVACPPCAKKLGDDSLHWCVLCNAVFQSFSRYTEGCSDECSHRIDEMVERAQQAQYDYIERRLEAL